MLKKSSVICISVFTISLFLIRAAISGITYDEAYTYLAYVRPLEDNLSIAALYSIFWGSVANNHWLNTFAITMADLMTGIRYSEFLIRLPSIICGCIYVAVSGYLYIRKEMNTFTYALLIGCYYLQEFFGLARGYGQSAALVLIGLVLYRRWSRTYEKGSILTLCLGFLLASAYANSIALIVCFCVGSVAIIRLLTHKTFFTFLRGYFPIIIIYCFFTYLIMRYHFRVSAPGMPLFASDSDSLMASVEEYVSMLFYGRILIKAVNVFFLIILLLSIAILVYQKKLWKLDLSISFIMFFILLLMMNTIFKRGGLFGRTLLPAYPLVAIGVSEIISGAYDGIREKIPYIAGKLVRLTEVVFLLLLVISFFMKIDITRTRDWTDDYNIKIDFYENPDFEASYDHASTVFYTEKSEWDLNNLKRDYSGEDVTFYNGG